MLNVFVCMRLCSVKILEKSEGDGVVQITHPVLIDACTDDDGAIDDDELDKWCAVLLANGIKTSKHWLTVKGSFSISMLINEFGAALVGYLDRLAGVSGVTVCGGPVCVCVAVPHAVAVILLICCTFAREHKALPPIHTPLASSRHGVVSVCVDSAPSRFIWLIRVGRARPLDHQHVHTFVSMQGMPLLCIVRIRRARA